MRRGLFFETKIRSFRATKINKNRGLIFKDNYCQLRRQCVSIQGELLVVMLNVVHHLIVV